MCHASWFSSKQHKNIWSSFLKICILTVLFVHSVFVLFVPSLLSSQVFLFLRYWPIFLFFSKKYLRASILSLTLTAPSVMTKCIMSVLLQSPASVIQLPKEVPIVRVFPFCQTLPAWLEPRWQWPEDCYNLAHRRVSIWADPSRSML